MTVKMPDTVSREAVEWAFRFFIGREPRDESEINFHRQHHSVEALRRAFSETGEFAGFQRALRGGTPYSVPVFMLQPPADASIPWHFAAPELARPVSQMCTHGQFQEAEFAHWCAELRMLPASHRKQWELCFILAAARAHGLLQPGMSALGFGVGREPIAALLAHYRLIVLATDAPAEIIAGQGWDSTGQHAAGLAALDQPEIVGFDQLSRQVRFRSVDMNAIPDDLHGFDWCWSTCAFEHLGSLEHGLRFVENSLAPLRPGGLAIHTTEFNLSSNEQTFESPGLCFYRKCDIERLAARLMAAGHSVMPLNFHPGDAALDAHVDLPPYALPHLKLQVAQFAATSIGIIVRKRA